ncbi:MAG: hypothetical protein ABIZ05_12540 [Pseudonocardiaceae bacterium]
MASRLSSPVAVDRARVRERVKLGQGPILNHVGAPPQILGGEAVENAFMKTHPRPERRKPGRKSKGPRVQVPVRLPTEFYEAVEEIAKRDGIWITDVVTRMVAESLGRPAPDYCHPKATSQQEELPLTRAS